ncbi:MULTISPECIES: hypothetical protein [unclassified Rhizobacter]|uniref:hypothetical protein n=1 Tax=unclassified Rhizobacter TaxID=2640088 RepID=UPI0006F7EE77|nr:MULTISPECIES: hypothetical protein [unclassified Rhizobacter]KQU81080.1 hypothetical protein ASC88_16285 [Rhizobacter sp. Root29]KQW04624.1 hypothetical protein ASC98_05975 [Rhizobacter sp. Root1238]
MIVLNQGKELVRVESWDDIVGRPGFNGNLNPAEHVLSGIIGQYAFADRIRCGLSDCHRPHGRGYLVVTKSGVETNIGKDCGKNYFGVDFETMATQFDRDMRDKQARERLWDFTFKLDELKQRIKALRTGERGADWVYKNSRPLVESGKGVPGVVIRRIADLLRTGDSVLTTEREPTEREIDLARVQGSRPPRVIVEKVADIRGLEALQSQNDLRQIMVVDLEEGIKEFEPLDVDTMKSTELSRWSKWVGRIEQKLDSAAAAISSGQALLAPANLQPFAILIPNFEAPETFRAYLKTLA